MVWAADFNTCAGPYPYFIDTSNPADDGSDVYFFPQVITCNVLNGISDVQLFPSDAGNNTVNFDCLNLPVGIYLYSFTDGRETIVGKFVKK